MKAEKPSAKERIEHIIDAINLIFEYTNNHSSESFLVDEKSYFACLYQYTIIGEAVANSDSEILSKYDYPWYKVKSFRNFILHEYHAVDKRVIWDTTRKVLPELLDLMKTILVNECSDEL
jgi:uncharacterized protein with HEPN domain